MFGIIPNFYVSYDTDPAPLTAGRKFKLALKVSADPVTVAGVLIRSQLPGRLEILRIMGKAGERMENVLAQSPPMVFPTS